MNRTSEASYASKLAYEVTDVRIAPESSSIEPSVAFRQQLNILAELVPALKGKEDIIDLAGEELIAAHGIPESFFDQGARSLVFAALAGRKVQCKDHTDITKKNEELGFINRATGVLRKDYMAAHAEDSIEYTEQRRRLGIHDAYTDWELSARFRQYLDSGVLDEIKQSMGIHLEGEAPYEVRVICADNGDNLVGLEPTLFKWDATMPHDENVKAHRRHCLERDTIGLRHRKLLDNGKEFVTAMGDDWETGLPTAWVTKLDGRRLMCIPLPLAQKLLDPTVFKTEPSPYQSFMNQVFVHHEYAHTQGNLSLEGEVNFGIGPEELRVMHFSGDIAGYEDIQYFYEDLAVVSGLDLKDVIDNLPLGGDITTIYAMLANELGLDAMLEVLLAAPAGYRQTDSFRRQAYTHLGGYDAILGRILDARLAQGQEGLITARVENHIVSLSDYGRFMGAAISHREEQGLSLVPGLVRNYQQNSSISLGSITCAISK